MKMKSSLKHAALFFFAVLGCLIVKGQVSSKDNDIIFDISKLQKCSVLENIIIDNNGAHVIVAKDFGNIKLPPTKIPIKGFEPYLSFTIKSIGIGIEVGKYKAFVRTSQKGKKWSDWILLNPVDDVNQVNEEGGDPNSYICNAPITDLSARFLQVKIEISDSSVFLQSIRLHFFSPGIIKKKPLSENLSKEQLSCPCPSLSFISRTSWGCVQSENCPVYDPNSGSNVNFTATPVSTFVVHHAAGYGYAPYDARLRDIWDLHVNVNGWSDIAYNWVIAPDGALYKGRAWNGGNDNVQGAHMCGCNSNKSGICLLGDFTNSGPTNSAYNELVALLGWKACSWGIPPTGSAVTDYKPNSTCTSGTLFNIIGHRDGCPQSPLYTSCPGNSFYPQISTLKSDVQSYINNCGSSPTVMCSNDDCNNAVTLTANGVWTSCSVDNAAPDYFSVPSCDNYSPQINILGAGVFFKFKASCNSHTITVDPIGTLDAIIVVYSGGCFVLQEIPGGCEDTPGGNGVTTILTVNNLTIDEWYTIRVYDYGSANATSGGFNIKLDGGTLPGPATISGPSSVCLGDAITYSANANGANNWNWSIPSSWSGSSNSFLINVNVGGSSGNFSIYATPFNDCGIGNQASYNIYVDPCTGFDEISSINAVITPNPSNGVFNIVKPIVNNPLEFYIVNPIGELILTDHILPSNSKVQKTIDLRGISKGIYFIKFSDQPNRSQKIIIN